MYEWEVVFKPDKSIRANAFKRGTASKRGKSIKAKAESRPAVSFLVVFNSKGDQPQDKPQVERLPNGALTLKFYGGMSIRSIPGGFGNGSYEIPCVRGQVIPKGDPPPPYDEES